MRTYHPRGNPGRNEAWAGRSKPQQKGYEKYGLGCLLAVGLAGPGLLAPDLRGQSQSRPSPVATSTEQGRVTLEDSFALPPGTDPGGETQFHYRFRTMSLERERFDGSSAEAVATGGWVGAKTGYLLDRFSFGVTGYTSQRLAGEVDEDGTGLLAPGQEGYSVLGEAYADILLLDRFNVYAGRKEFDTPLVNGSDSRMTPNTFELLVLQGIADVGPHRRALKYGVGWFDRIKTKTSEDFVSMGLAAGAPAERGVLASGAVFENDGLSVGAIGYHSADVLNMFYAQSTWKLPLRLPFAEEAAPSLAAQFIDQRSTGAGLLADGDFSAQQFGLKGELPAGRALFTVAYTLASGDDGLRSPWGSHPGYTGVQVEDFNRAGEGALMARAGYDLPWIDGLTAYALFVNGGSPDDPGEHRKDELDLNLQWTPAQEWLEGLSLRLRYALVEEHGPTNRELTDLRLICNYRIDF